MQEITFHCRLSLWHSFTTGPRPLLHSDHAQVYSTLLLLSVEHVMLHHDLMAEMSLVAVFIGHVTLISFFVLLQETER